MLTITSDHPAFKAYLDELQRRLGNLTPVMDSIGMEMESRVSGRFETRTDPDGVAWAPWAPSTEKYYPRSGASASERRIASGGGILKKLYSSMGKTKQKTGAGNGSVLDRYGDMLLSLTHKADSNSVRIGFGQPYATFHEYGTKHMPRRGLLMSDPEKGEMSKPDEAAVLEIINDMLQKT